jgi:hypothetical protein
MGHMIERQIIVFVQMIGLFERTESIFKMHELECMLLFHIVFFQASTAEEYMGLCVLPIRQTQCLLAPIDRFIDLVTTRKPLIQNKSA